MPDHAGEDRAVGRPIDAAELLHGARGERDLVAAELPKPALDLEQPVHLVLDAIGRIHGAWCIGAAQRPEPFAPPVRLEDLPRDALHLLLVHRAHEDDPCSSRAAKRARNASVELACGNGVSGTGTPRNRQSGPQPSETW